MDLARRPGPSVRVRVQEFREDSLRSREDRLATEEPLEIRLAWPGHAAERVGVTMRTPGQDFELAAGLLFAEGLLSPVALERSEEHTSELQSLTNLVCRLLLEKKKKSYRSLPARKKKAATD